MLPDLLSRSVNEDLLRFLWRQWSQLGVAGSVEFRDRWIIDPEALLLFTMDVGRSDPRLFDEVVDWTVRNGRWISLQRLKNMAQSADNEVGRTLAAVAAVVDSRDTKHRWRAIARMFTSPTDGDAPFFLDVEGNPLPVIGERDQRFTRMGFARQVVDLRHLSVPVPMGPASNLLFKLRSLVGLSPRAEVAAYLMTHASGRVSMIARSTVYSHPAVHDALDELTQSGLTYAQKRGLFSVDSARWHQFLEIQGALPVWIEWPRVFAALSALARFLTDCEKTQLSEYLLISRILTLNDTLREKLSDCGIANPFIKPCSLDDALESLPDRIHQLLCEINGRSAELNSN